MSIDEEIDRSFGSGPEPDPVAVLLDRGHRALRRRQLATSTAAVAAVVVFGGAAALVAGGGDDRASVGPVAQPTPSATEASAPTPTPTPSPGLRTPTHEEAHRAMGIDPIAAYDDHGKVTIDPKATVLQRIDNPFDNVAPESSVALALEYRGVEYWFAMHLDQLGGSNSSATWAGDYPNLTLSDWVGQQTALGQSQTEVGPGVWPGQPNLDLVRFAGAGETLAPRSGATILEQRPHVSVGASFAGPNDQTAAATVRDASGAVYYVLARRFDGKPGQYIAVSRADGGPSLDAFLDLARQRYAEGGGGLL